MDRILIPTEVHLPVSDETQSFLESLSEKLASFLNSSMEDDPRKFRVDIDCEALDKYERPIFNICLIEIIEMTGLPFGSCKAGSLIGMTTLLIDDNFKLEDFSDSLWFTSIKFNFLEKIKERKYDL